MPDVSVLLVQMKSCLTKASKKGQYFLLHFEFEAELELKSVCGGGRGF